MLRHVIRLGFVVNQEKSALLLARVTYLGLELDSQSMNAQFCVLGAAHPEHDGCRPPSGAFRPATRVVAPTVIQPPSPPSYSGQTQGLAVPHSKGGILSSG